VEALPASQLASDGSNMTDVHLSEPEWESMPIRPGSLVGRSGSMLMGALSLSRQSTYVPLTEGTSSGANPWTELPEPPVREMSLRKRFGSVSVVKQASYMPLELAENGPAEADNLSSSSGKRRALLRDAGLGQRLESILKGALSLPRQSSYMSIDGDEAQEHDDSSPSRRRALPRDTSYVPEWVNRGLGHTPGMAAPAFARALALAVIQVMLLQTCLTVLSPNGWIGLTWHQLKQHKLLVPALPLPCRALALPVALLLSLGAMALPLTRSAPLVIPPPEVFLRNP